MPSIFELENAMKTWMVTEFKRRQEFRNGCSICGDLELCSSFLGASARAAPCARCRSNDVFFLLRCAGAGMCFLFFFFF